MVGNGGYNNAPVSSSGTTAGYGRVLSRQPSSDDGYN